MFEEASDKLTIHERDTAEPPFMDSPQLAPLRSSDASYSLPAASREEEESQNQESIILGQLEGQPLSDALHGHTENDHCIHEMGDNPRDHNAESTSSIDLDSVITKPQLSREYVFWTMRPANTGPREIIDLDFKVNILGRLLVEETEKLPAQAANLRPKPTKKPMEKQAIQTSGGGYWPDTWGVVPEYGYSPYPSDHSISTGAYPQAPNHYGYAQQPADYVDDHDFPQSYPEYPHVSHRVNPSVQAKASSNHMGWKYPPHSHYVDPRNNWYGAIHEPHPRKIVFPEQTSYPLAGPRPKRQC